MSRSIEWIPDQKGEPPVNEWVIVAIVAIVVIFGVNKLPQIARNLGKAQNEFKQGLKEGSAEADTPPAETSKPAEQPPSS